MLCVYQSNRLEYLAHALATIHRQPAGNSVWQPEEIVVQSQGMRRYLNRFLAGTSGIAANLRYSLPAGLGWRLLQQVLPDAPALNPYHPEVLRWRLLALFNSPAFAQSPDWDTVRTALQPYLRSSRHAAYHLAGKLADVFDQYLVYRSDWIETWQTGRLLGNLGPDECWQARLWQQLADDTGGRHRAAQWQYLLQHLRAEHLPPRLLVFGISSLAPAYLSLLQTIAQHCDVHVFALNPSSDHWGNVLPTARLAQLGDADRSGSGHPLLASLGKQGRDFFDALAEMPHVRYEIPIYDPLPDNPSLLHRLQDDIQNLRLPETVPHVRIDDSICIQSAHSPVRELQILKDRLLQDLAAHPDWQPHDIAVLTPHLEPYLPFIDAIFGQSQGGNQVLPYSVADVRTRSREPLLQLLGDWLVWAQSRCETEYLLPLLDSPLLRQHFALSQADIDLLLQLLQQQGTRWGEDAAMRAAHGGSDDAFTWQHARQRTVLGWLLPQTDPPQSWQGVLPWHADINHTETLARLQILTDTLLEHHHHWQSATDTAGWLHRIRQLLADLCDEAALATPAMQQWEQKLAAWGEQAALAGFVAPLPLPLATEHLNSLLDSRDDAGLLRGGITFCSMVPMRSLPFKCICLLGLNDGDYPRTTKTAHFDLMSRYPRRGDRARHDDDRYLFLESLLSAREKLYLSYIGRDQRKNEVLAPSALIHELADTLAEMTGCPTGSWLEQQACQHPLQAFSPRYFDGSLPSTRQDLAQAFNARRTEVTSPPFYVPVAPADAAFLNLDIESLIRFWRNPLRAWLRQLAWQPFYPATLPAAEEPFALPDVALINQQLLAGRRARRDWAQIGPQLQQMNALPDGLLGQSLLQPWREAAWALDAEIVCSPRLPDAVWTWQHGNITLSGSLGQLHRDGQIIWQYRAPNAPEQIALYLRHLIFCAAGLSHLPARTHVLYPPEPWVWGPIDPEQARRLLGLWLDAWQLGQQQPLPFFARTSLAAAKAWHQAGHPESPPEKVQPTARHVYLGSEHQHGQQHETEVALVFGRDAQLPVDGALFWQLVGDLLLPLQHLSNAPEVDA